MASDDTPPDAYDVFREAIELDAGPARDAHLDVLCRDFPELRAEVDDLLALHENPATALRELDADTAAATPPPSPEPTPSRKLTWLLSGAALLGVIAIALWNGDPEPAPRPPTVPPELAALRPDRADLGLDSEGRAVVAYAESTDLVVAELRPDGSRHVRTRIALDDAIRSPVLSTCATRVAAVSGRSGVDASRLHVWNAQTGAEIASCRIGEREVEPGACFDAASCRVAWPTADRNVTVVDVLTGRVREVWIGTRLSLPLGFGDADGRAHLRIDGSAWDESEGRHEPGGRVVLTGPGRAQARTVGDRGLEISGADGWTESFRFDAPTEIRTACFSPTGEDFALVTHDGRLFSWSRNEPGRCRSAPCDARRLALHRGGTLFALGTQGVQRFDLAAIPTAR